MSTCTVHSVAPTAPHTHTIIFLHGRGSNAHEFASELFESQASDGRFLTDMLTGYKWVFPCAAVRWAETEQENMHQWFDMASVQEPHLNPEIQLRGLRESVQGIWDIMRRESEKVGGYEKVFLAGISQGCVVGVVALLVGGMQVAGFIGMSSWLPFSPSSSLVLSKKEFVGWVQENLQPILTAVSLLHGSGLETAVRVPVLLEHAGDDEVVPVEKGRMLCEGLRGLGMQVKWKEYKDGGHWVNEPNGIDDMVKFMGRCS